MISAEQGKNEARVNFANTGVIVLPPVRFGPGGSLNYSYGESEARLLFFKTYFDNVAVAPFNVVAGREVCTSSLLEQVLVSQDSIRLALPERHQFGTLNAEYIAQSGLSAYEALNNTEPGKWALAPHGEVAHELSSAGQECLIIALEKCLPAPRPDVPLHEILDFREQNKSALDRLHHELERFAMSLNAGRPFEDRLRVFSKDLELSILDIRAAFDKSKIPHGFVTFSPSVQVPAEFLTAAGGAGAILVGLPVAIGMLAGAFLSIQIKRSRINRATNYLPRNFEYVVSGLRDGLLKSHPDLADRFELDIENVMISNVNSWSFYPRRVAHPGKMKDCVFSNIVMI